MGQTLKVSPLAQDALTRIIFRMISSWSDHQYSEASALLEFIIITTIIIIDIILHFSFSCEPRKSEYPKFSQA